MPLGNLGNLSSIFKTTSKASGSISKQFMQGFDKVELAQFRDLANNLASTDQNIGQVEVPQTSTFLKSSGRGASTAEGEKIIEGFRKRQQQISQRRAAPGIEQTRIA